jgi:flagellar biosynthesis anti-sigma factor FlgM
MRVENSASVNRVQGVRSKNLYGVEGTAGAGQDSVELSARAADLRTALNALAGLPEVREERVAELRAQLEQGSFDPAVDALAGKLLKK